MIKSIGSNQQQMIADILLLHGDGMIECDPTYSKGNFYKNGVVQQPKFKFDLFPQTEDTIKANANKLPLESNSINSIIFDPPFLAGYTKEAATGIIGERFNGFRYMKDVWEWYSECIAEFSRVLKQGGLLIFKCQDTISSGKQWLSHVHVINESAKSGFYCKDLFVLTANSRIVGHNHKVQKHARKFHSYFLVFKNLGK